MGTNQASIDISWKKTSSHPILSLLQEGEIHIQARTTSHMFSSLAFGGQQAESIQIRIRNGWGPTTRSG
jgi:hypothetical protein